MMNQSSFIRNSCRVGGLAALLLVGSMSGQAAASTGQDTPADIITLSTNPGTGLSVDELAPGDTTQWATSVQNISGRTVPVSAEFGIDEEVAQSPLTLDTTYGMQVSLDTCSQPWTPGQSGPMAATTFTCDGDVETLMPSMPLGDLDGVPFQSGTSLVADGTLNIRATMEFPRSAGNDFENLKGGVRVLFTSSYDDPPATIPPTTVPPTVPGENPPPPATPPVPPSVKQPAPPFLPQTGSDMLAVGAIGAALVAAGLAILSASRKRKANANLQDVMATYTTDDTASASGAGKV